MMSAFTDKQHINLQTFKIKFNEIKLFLSNFNSICILRIFFTTDIDECESKPCNVTQTCFNSEGSFKCGCLTGLQMDKVTQRCEGNLCHQLYHQGFIKIFSCVKRELNNCLIFNISELAFQISKSFFFHS